MRVTNSMVLSSTLGDLNRSLSRLQDSQTELSTGRTIRRMSDDPTGASSAMTIRGQLRRMQQHERSANDAQGWLGTADAAIVSGLDVMNKLKEVVVRASNSGAMDNVARTAIAAEIGSLRDELLALANTRYLDRPIFNGTADGNAYTAAGVYAGNTGRVVREVAAGTTMDVNLTGPAAFGDPSAPEGDVFAVLDRLQTAVSAGNMAAVAAEHVFVDTAQTRLSSAASQVGSRGARLEGIRDRLVAADVTLRESLSQLEDADIAQALMSVKARENAYTASLQAAARVIPPSLVDYLR